MLKNGTLASPAIAFASSVLPVPGLPTISTPRGMRPPSFWNLPGSRRNSTSSLTSSLASSQPATSAKVTWLLLSSSMRARLLPNENAPPRPPPCIWRMKKIHTPISSSIGNQEMNTCIRKPLLLLRLGFHVHAVLEQVAHHPQIGRRIGDELLAGFLDALDDLAFDRHLGHVAGTDLLDERGVVHRLLRRLAGAELVEHRHQHQGDDQPDGDVLDEVIQECSYAPRGATVVRTMIV